MHTYTYIHTDRQTETNKQAQPYIHHIQKYIQAYIHKCKQGTNTYIHTNIQADTGIPSGKKSDTQTYRHTQNKAYIHTGKQTYIQPGRQTNIHADMPTCR